MLAIIFSFMGLPLPPLFLIGILFLLAIIHAVFAIITLILTNSGISGRGHVAEVPEAAGNPEKVREIKKNTKTLKLSYVIFVAIMAIIVTRACLPSRFSLLRFWKTSVAK